jgi:hypothetical protein
MPFLDDDARISAVEQGLGSPFWQDYLLPMLLEKGKQQLRNLAAKASDSDDILRGKYQAYQDIINSVTQEVEIYRQEAQRQATVNDAAFREEARANLGFRAPYSVPVQPGDLKEDESESTDANRPERETA